MADEEQDRVDRQGHWAQQAEARLPDRRWREEVDRGLAYGLQAADSITATFSQFSITNS